MMRKLVDKYNSQAGKDKVDEVFDEAQVKMPCRITYIEKDFGKWTPHWGINMYLEYDEVLPLMSYYLPAPLNEHASFAEYLRTTPKLLDEFADSFVVTMPTPRLQAFSDPDIQVIRGKISKYLEEVEEALGFYPVNVGSELLYDLGNYSRMVLFIGLIFDLVIILLVIISVLLIYSLLLINIETRTFETGVQRMIGLSKKGIVLLVMVQSFLFVLPSVAFGFMASVPSLAVFSGVLESLLNVTIQPIPSTNAIIQALFIGIVIPLLSSLIPINIALARNLNDALDY